MSEQVILTAQDLTKIYYSHDSHQIRAVDGINFEVFEGEIFGLLGPNGAGKTTTIGMLTTQVIITSGNAIIGGISVLENSLEVKREIAVVPQQINLDRALTAWENLIFHAKYFGIPKKEREEKAWKFLELMDLADRAHDYVPQFSGGMARRLMIARALMHDPKVIFLDEATTGLDPQSRHLIWHKIRELNEEGKTIFLTTHYMEEADQLCHRVAVMDYGKILVLDAPQKLKELVPNGKFIELKAESFPKAFLDTIKKESKFREVKFEEGCLKIYPTNKAEEVFSLITRIAPDYNLNLQAILLHLPSLEDLFIYLTGRRLRA